MSSVHASPEPVGGPLFTRPFRILVGVFAFCALFMLYRFAAGLGASTGLSDGYPWGIWIAFDVVTGTALACGGYAVALLVYVLNKGKFHPLVRPALLTSALGYTTAAVAIHLDVGRPWLLYRVPLYVGNWNLNSALFEVAICVMAYVAVLWIEVSPALMERFKEGPDGFLKRTSDRLYGPVTKALPWVIALGLLLPTMHQSSLGTVMLLTGKRLHPLWHTPILPLLFLVSCLGMGYAVVVFESMLSAALLKRPRETRMLADLSKTMNAVLVGFVVLRFLDLLVRGRLGLMFAVDRHALFFWVETVLFLLPVVLLRSARLREDAGNLFRAAMVMMFAGTLYRFDTYLVAFHPGSQWTYFPSAPEILITVGVVALEVIAYVVIVKNFPILSGAPRPAAASAR
ncbi:Ni/Fe-hydrogenase cytochrome b subunit [Acidobacteria bacterium ACD]|nr:MAG: Ni/Fe-hydrogenase cytochrome b subunit [Acidobacteriota bacterium]MCE7958463.1 Ni/Fe-hydrogenase cytochrome b subunit [Acidobacteria bacterium ACB2]MDL1950810.1 Ni/Fe-hydrogenase cytochrome b subunit [Acidobacteria bacterium ACD]